jgi:hypothetical protein
VPGRGAFMDIGRPRIASSDLLVFLHSYDPVGGRDSSSILALVGLPTQPYIIGAVLWLETLAQAGSPPTHMLAVSAVLMIYRPSASAWPTAPPQAAQQEQCGERVRRGQTASTCSQGRRVRKTSKSEEAMRAANVHDAPRPAHSFSRLETLLPERRGSRGGNAMLARLVMREVWFSKVRGIAMV